MDYLRGRKDQTRRRIKERQDGNVLPDNIVMIAFFFFMVFYWLKVERLSINEKEVV